MNYLMIDNLVFGGAERQASYLIDNHVGLDKVILLENKIMYELNNELPMKVLHSDVLKTYQRLFGDKEALKTLTKMLTVKDTVVSFLERSNIINIKASFKTGHNSIISVRNYLSERYKHPKYFYRVFLIKKYYPKAKKIITNSTESKRDLVKNFDVPEEKIQVIYNSIDLKNTIKLKQEKLPVEHKYIFENPVITNVGSLTPQKAQKQLIEAFAKVKKNHPQYKLVIIGSGNLKKELNKTIKNTDLQNDVFLIGNVQNPFKYIYRSDMFVLNSNFEGFPNVLIESLSVGTPVISKNCLSGPKELLNIHQYRNKNVELTDFGYIIPKLPHTNGYQKEKKHLIDSIQKMIRLKENDKVSYQRLQMNCEKRAADFSEEHILKQWNDEILNGN